MIRFLVMYPAPIDPEAFDRHYYEVHLPLARKLPGLRSYNVSHKPPTPIRGDNALHLVAELEYDDMETLRATFASPLGQQLAQDVDRLAELCPGVQSMVYELQTLHSDATVTSPAT